MVQNFSQYHCIEKESFMSTREQKKSPGTD